MSSEAIPTLSHPDRLLFEHAHNSGNSILKASLSLDARIRQLQANAQQSTLHPSNFALPIAAMESQTHRALEQAKRTGGGSWNEFFRLVSQTAFLEQRIMVPLVFGGADNRELRAYLANGIYGLNVNILEQELTELDNYHTVFERQQLRGAIQEQTAPALLHRGKNGENGTAFALPSATGDDLQRRIDIDYWRLSDTGQTYEHMPIQVKTHPRTDGQSVAPKQGIVITARDMRNESFHTSRLLVGELNNTLTDYEQHELDDIQQQLLTVINEKYNALN